MRMRQHISAAVGTLAHVGFVIADGRAEPKWPGEFTLRGRDHASGDLNRLNGLGAHGGANRVACAHSILMPVFLTTLAHISISPRIFARVASVESTDISEPPAST